MTQNEIIEMAKQVGMIKDGEWWFSSFYKTEQDVHISHLEDFAKLVAQHEREAYAKLFDERDKDIGWYDPGEPAEIIRTRGRDAP